MNSIGAPPAVAVVGTPTSPDEMESTPMVWVSWASSTGDPSAAATEERSLIEVAPPLLSPLWGVPMGSPIRSFRVVVEPAASVRAPVCPVKVPAWTE